MVDQLPVNFTYAAPRTTPVRAVRSEWLDNWLAGDTPDQLLLESIGFQANQYYAVVIYQPRSDSVGASQFAGFVQQAAARRGINGPVLAHQISGVLFHPVEDPQQTARLKLKTEEIREQLVYHLHGTLVYCGVGRPARGMDGLRASFREAEDAVRLCSEIQTPQTRPTFFGNSSLYNLLLSLKNPGDLERFCMNWLSDLLGYDNEQHSELVSTLSTYFANNGNTALTAKELKIHRNTLAYRLNRIAEITCLDLDDADVRLNLHLALKAYEMLGAPQSGINLH